MVHQTKDEDNSAGKVIYLSGNTPLVLVIREALAQDEFHRCKAKGERKTLGNIRHDLQTRIQHVNDFLKEYYIHDFKNHHLSMQLFLMRPSVHGTISTEKINSDVMPLSQN